MSSFEFKSVRYLRNRNTHRRREQTCGCQGGGGVGRDELGFWVSRCKLLRTEWKNKVLLYSAGSYIQYPVINRNGNEYEKEYI